MIRLQLSRAFLDTFFFYCHPSKCNIIYPSVKFLRSSFLSTIMSINGIHKDLRLVFCVCVLYTGSSLTPSGWYSFNTSLAWVYICETLTHTHCYNVHWSSLFSLKAHREKEKEREKWCCLCGYGVKAFSRHCNSICIYCIYIYCNIVHILYLYAYKRGETPGHIKECKDL